MKLHALLLAAAVLALPAHGEILGRKPAYLWGGPSSVLPIPGAVLGQHEVMIATEDLEFDGEGWLWTVSEAGSQRWSKWSATYPLVFQLDLSKLK